MSVHMSIHKTKSRYDAKDAKHGHNLKAAELVLTHQAPRTNRWSLLSQEVSVRRSVCPENKNRYMGAWWVTLKVAKPVFLCFQWTSPRVALREATVRMMAGASPGMTQRILDQSMVQKCSGKGIICGKGKNEYQPL